MPSSRDNESVKYFSFSERMGDDSELIDIESVAEEDESQFDTTKANTLMTECERHMKIARPTALHFDEPIDRQVHFV